MAIVAFIVANKVLISSIGLTIGSELMSLNPSMKSNGWVQLIVSLFKSISGK